MAMGRVKNEQQETFWVETAALPQAPRHAFYDQVNGALAYQEFDRFVEERCAKFYAEKMGRPSVPPVVYFKMLFIGYFEGIDSERGIAWRVADSLTLRRFLGYELTDETPDHSSVSRTRRRIDLETHQAVFQWVLTTLAMEGLLKGKTLGVDATTLEANAALRSIVRRDTGESYEAFLTGLAQASGIETPTREDLAKLDKGRKGKGSNREWTHPHDPDASIAKMKDGRTHLAHKAEHAVDLETGALAAVTVQGAHEGDTETIEDTLDQAEENLEEVAKEPDAARGLSDKPVSEAVTDKGYHSSARVQALTDAEKRTYLSEPNRGRRKWRGNAAAQQAVYANRRRIRGERGKRLLRKRGELVERSFAHLYETGGMRRTHLRGHENILKRLLIHAGAFNLGLLLRHQAGAGTPRGLSEALRGVMDALRATLHTLVPLPSRYLAPRLATTRDSAFRRLLMAA